MFGVLTSQKIIYKKPLKRWKKFNITLKIEGSDEKWVYIDRFLSKMVKHVQLVLQKQDFGK